MDLHIYHHFPGNGVPSWAVDLGKKMDLVLSNQVKIMATVDQVLAEVTAESSRLDSIQALIDGIKQQLADALSGATIPPAVQTKIDAVFAGLTTNSAKIDKALNTNVPPPLPAP